MSEQQPGYVFNMDQQDYRRQFAIVVEGPMDAIGIEGLALLGSEVKDQQHLLIKSLNKQVILVPDRDEAGHKLIEQAIEFGWSVSMPDWDEDVNDVNDAIKKYGRIYTLHQIVTHAESSSLKIKLRSKKWFG
jgi:DNA primase